MKVKQGDHVVQGDLLLAFDLEAINAAGYSTVTPVVITNFKNFHEVVPEYSSTSIHVGDKLISVK